MCVCGGGGGNLPFLPLEGKKASTVYKQTLGSGQTCSLGLGNLNATFFCLHLSRLSDCFGVNLFYSTDMEFTTPMTLFIEDIFGM